MSSAQSRPRSIIDLESGQKVASFGDQIVRAGFMRKVFGLLGLQLALTSAIGAAIVFNAATKAFIVTHPSICLLSFVASLGIMLTFMFSEHARYSHPLNLVLLFSFTAAEGVLVGAASSTYSTNTVVLAFAMTAAVSTGLALYAVRSKKDFTAMGGCLYAMAMALIMAMVVNIFFDASLFTLVVSLGGAALFSMYLVYDIQLLMGGEHQYALSPDDYVLGAVAIYLDIINLFLHILKALNSSRNN